MRTPTFMKQEIDEIPQAVRRLLGEQATALAEAGQLLAARDPILIATVARGSSDNAAAYLKYAIELVAGVPVASLGPSLASLYGAHLRFERGGAIAISQSGKSPDIVAMTKAVRAGGAATLALTNVAGSPLAAAADRAIDLRGGPERSVAATKSFVASIVAGLAILAHWKKDDALVAALAALPDQFGQAVACDWSELIAALDGRESLFVLGRGPALAIAAEAALKFKETCGIHAEACSAAEVLHGPVSIVRRGFPVLALTARDAAERATLETAGRIAAQGGEVFVTAEAAAGVRPLPFVATGHPLTDPLPLIVGFYAFIEALARRRGLDPDSPPHLHKVTETI